MIDIKMTGFDELQKKLADMTDPHGEYMKEVMINRMFENVPEVAAQRDKISFVDTFDGFKIVCSDMPDDLAARVQVYFDSISNTTSD